MHQQRPSEWSKMKVDDVTSVIKTEGNNVRVNTSVLPLWRPYGCTSRFLDQMSDALVSYVRTRLHSHDAHVHEKAGHYRRRQHFRHRCQRGGCAAQCEFTKHGAKNLHTSQGSHRRQEGRSCGNVPCCGPGTPN